MKPGKKSVENIKDPIVLQKILGSIIDDCITYAGDSYEDFAKATIQDLRCYKLVEYGDPDSELNREEDYEDKE